MSKGKGQGLQASAQILVLLLNDLVTGTRSLLWAPVSSSVNGDKILSSEIHWEPNELTLVLTGLYMKKHLISSFFKLTASVPWVTEEGKRNKRQRAPCIRKQLLCNKPPQSTVVWNSMHVLLLRNLGVVLPIWVRHGWPFRAGLWVCSQLGQRLGLNVLGKVSLICLVVSWLLALASVVTEPWISYHLQGQHKLVGKASGQSSQTESKRRQGLLIARLETSILSISNIF